MILDHPGYSVLTAHISNKLSWLSYLFLKFNEFILDFCIQVKIREIK